MNVDFNNLRVQTCNLFDALVYKLNDAILKSDQYAIPNEVYNGQEINIKGYVLIDAESIEQEINRLSMLIGAIACTYEDGNEKFKDVSDAIADSFAVFNEKED